MDEITRCDYYERSKGDTAKWGWQQGEAEWKGRYGGLESDDSQLSRECTNDNGDMVKRMKRRGECVYMEQGEKLR